MVVGSAAFELQELFGRPRTRARALAYAKRAVLNTQQNVAKKDEATLTTAKERQPRGGRVGMTLEPDHIAGRKQPPDPNSRDRANHTTLLQCQVLWSRQSGSCPLQR